MATRKTKVESAAVSKPAPAARKRATGATHAAPARKRPATKTPTAAAVVNHEEQYVITQEQIAALAYSYWEERGRTPGDEAADWLRAEQELLERARSTRA